MKNCNELEHSNNKTDDRRRNSKKRWLSVCLIVINFYLLSSIFYFPYTLKIARAQEWQKLKSEHFIIFYVDGKQFAKDVSRKSEKYYRRIASELGYQRYSGFWTWDNRVKIYIYPDRESFLAATDQPKWSEGVANFTKKEISSYAWSEGFLDALLPHEMAHLIFRDYVGFKGEVPLWIDEGVAQWMEPKKREIVKYAVKRLEEQGKLISLQKMMTLDVRRSGDSALVTNFYIQAMSLVSFLINKYSAARFTNFCRQLRDGKTIVDSLKFAYPTSIRSIEDLQEKWLKYIKEE